MASDVTEKQKPRVRWKMSKNKYENLLHNLQGLEAWGLKITIGGMTLHFGPRHFTPDGFERGEWSLWIQTRIAIAAARNRLLDINDPVEQNADTLSRYLVGKTVLRVGFDESNNSLRLLFPPDTLLSVSTSICERTAPQSGDTREAVDIRLYSIHTAPRTTVAWRLFLYGSKVMRRTFNMTLKCLIICCIAMTSMSCWAQNDLEQFEKQFFSPVQISKLGTDQGQSASLSSTSRSDLSAARKTLIDFFYATENVNADPRMYLEQVFASKYKERSDIGRSLFGEETTLLTVGFTGFSIRESTAELRFYVVIFAEGEIVANKSSARLRKMGGGWKITEVGGLK